VWKTKCYERVTSCYLCCVIPKNTFFASDWFDSNFLGGFVQSDSQIKHRLNKQIHKIGENQISSRVLNHWYEKGIIIDDRPENKGWKKFSFSDAVWVTIVIKLRKFGLSLDQIKLGKEQLDYYNKIDKVSKCSLLDFYIVVAMNSCIPIKLVVFESGQTDIVRQIDLDIANTINNITEDFISIDINKIVSKMLNKQGAAADYLGYSDIPISPVVKEIEKSLSAKDIQSVTIRVKNKDYVVDESFFTKDRKKANQLMKMLDFGQLVENKNAGKSTYQITNKKKIKRDNP
jgi:DNA-binding transcriptional MerR regulator